MFGKKNWKPGGVPIGSNFSIVQYCSKNIFDILLKEDNLMNAIFLNFNLKSKLKKESFWGVYLESRVAYMCISGGSRLLTKSKHW